MKDNLFLACFYVLIFGLFFWVIILHSDSKKLISRIDKVEAFQSQFTLVDTVNTAEVSKEDVKNEKQL